MGHKWLPTAPGVCPRCVCVCSLLCVCTLDGLNAEHTNQVSSFICHIHDYTEIV